MIMKRYVIFLCAIFILNVSTSQSIFSETSLSYRKDQLKQVEKEIVPDVEGPDQAIPNPTLNSFIETSLKHNPALKAAFYDWKSSLMKVSVEFSLPDPQVSYTNYLESVETRVGPQEHAYSIMQKIPLPDKLWIKKNRQFKASEAAFYQFQNKKLDLIYQITTAYYEYAYLARSIAIMEENINLLKNFESVARAKYTTGIAKNQDLLKVQVEIERLENELITLKDFRQPLMAQLNMLLDQPDNTVLPWPNEDLGDIPFMDIAELPEELIHKLKKNNPELLSLEEKISESKETVKLAKRAYFPDLTVGVTKIDTGEAMNPATIDSGKDPVMVIFSFNIPLWFGKNEAEIESSKAFLLASEAKLFNRENELEYQISLVKYKLDDSVRQSKLFQSSLIPKAEQTLNATKSSYEAGNTDFLSLIDAQRVLLQFQLAYFRQVTLAHQKKAEMKKILGRKENK